MPKCLSKFWKKMSAGRKIRRSSHGRSLSARAIEKHGLRRNIYTRNAERTRKKFQNNSPLTPKGANVLTYTYECIALSRLIQTIEGGTGGRERTNHSSHNRRSQSVQLSRSKTRDWLSASENFRTDYFRTLFIHETKTTLRARTAIAVR